jgi:hypothetical protein
MRGLFVQTERVRDVDAPIRLDFLVQEGQIRAEVNSIPKIGDGTKRCA